MNEVLRQEKKLLITLDQMYQISANAEKFLMPDPHNFADGYLIRSLYFDTIDERDYMEKEEGVEIRRKIRLRTYGPDYSFGVLEMKQKQGPMQKKRSLKLSKQDSEQLIKGNYSVLLNYNEPFAAECYAYMNLHAYLPKSIVEYRRKAYIAKENKIRITFDHHIVATESNFNLFDAKLQQNPVLNPQLCVLEVKYNGFLLSYIKDLLWDVNKSETSVSKYSLSRSTTMHYNF